ncbi:SLC13 family permease [Alkalilimnicola ehrlichii MLHE-1]|uniref:Anion transporter n=2 Tax=Alkalilimnicola ehrlichii TaxID=351052 RepID=Q0A7A9_ALKEH|nr:anion transporter [Alkalilimnicola ehrlichii MLHE-1]
MSPPGPDNTQQPERAAHHWRRVFGLLLGPSLFALMVGLGPPGELSPEAWRVAALTLLMATWWVSEALPLPVTALLPVVVLPLMGVSSVESAAAPYANPLIFLFLGGFLLAMAIQRWNLHRRIAITILSLAGRRPDLLIGGFMVATAGLSMWVSNTATAAMMLPIGLSVIALLEDRGGRIERDFVLGLLIGIAFAANIGGMGTLIGTPPNALLAGFLADRQGVVIGFAQWMLLGVPLALTLLLITWWLLTHKVYRVERQTMEGITELIATQRKSLGRIGRGERRVAIIFALTALAWVSRPLLQQVWPWGVLSDAGIALTAGVALFLVPVDWRRQQFLLDWASTRELPWGVLVLVGGGLSLGVAIEESGLSSAIALLLTDLAGWPVWSLIAVIAALTMLLSHVTSNTATAATLLPLMVSLALMLELDPLLLAVPVALAASCAFMLPVATPPNAIIFGSERLRVTDMLYAGAWVTAAALPLLVLVSTLLVIPLLGD